MRLVSLSALALFVVACSPATSPGDQASSQEPTMKTYENSAYGISFDYPAEYALRGYAAESATVGTLSGETMLGKVDIEVARSTNSPEDAEYDMFVAKILRQSCAADGPTGSYACTDVISRDPVKTPSGLSADEIYLKSEEERAGSSEAITDERGPFIVFNLGATVSGSGFTVLVIRPSSNVPVSDIDEQLVRFVRDTVRLQKVGTSPSSAMDRPRAMEGELCGGIAGFQCDAGLKCRYDGNYPDAAGVCVKG